MTATLDIAVDGVTCAGCARGIRMGLVALPEVDTVDVDISSGVVHVAGAALGADRIRRQLAWLGFPPITEGDDDEDR